MRLLHVSDFHSNKSWFEWLAERSQNFDAVCFAGDFLSLFPGPQVPVSLEVQAEWIVGWLGRFPARLFTCSGNHDVSSSAPGMDESEAHAGWLKAARMPGRVWSDGDCVEALGTTFLCAGWSRPLPILPSAPTVLVRHCPPARTSVSTEGENDWGDESGRDAADMLPRGSLLLCGHVHLPVRWVEKVGGTWVLNPGTDESADVPNFVEVDLGKRVAWRHTERLGVEAVRLV